uniref:Galectin n=1 Tax=Ditylenchus dipsaci TaxID=166011 RepID=A0A915DA82_9BILA
MYIIDNPPMPFTHPLYGGLSTNAEIVVTGKPYHGPNKSFGVNFRVGSNDIALHINPRFKFLEHRIVLNSQVYGLWQKEERHSNYIRMDEVFTLKVCAHNDHFKIYVDNCLVGRFDHRIPVGNITHLEVVGEVALLKVALYNVSTGNTKLQPSATTCLSSAPYPNVVHQNTTTTTTYQTPYPNQNAYPNAPPVYPTIPQSYNPQSPNPNARPY